MAYYALNLSVAVELQWSRFYIYIERLSPFSHLTVACSGIFALDKVDRPNVSGTATPQNCFSLRCTPRSDIQPAARSDEALLKRGMSIWRVSSMEAASSNLEAGMMKGTGTPNLCPVLLYSHPLTFSHS